MKADAMKRLKQLEAENARLKKIVAEQQAVDIDILKEVSLKKLLRPARRRAAVRHVRRRLGVSERRAAQAGGSPSPAPGQRYTETQGPTRIAGSPSAACRSPSRGRPPATGYRRVWALLRREKVGGSTRSG